MKPPYAILMALGAEIVGLILLGIWIGSYIDATYSWRGFGLISGIVLALVIWFVHIFTVLAKIQRESPDRDSE